MAPVSSEAAKRKTLSRQRALVMGRLINPSVPFAGVCKACLGSLLQRAASIGSCRGSRPFATSPRFGTRVEPPCQASCTTADLLAQQLLFRCGEFLEFIFTHFRIRRVNHLLSAGTTYHGASFVAVCWIICSYACM